MVKGDGEICPASCCDAVFCKIPVTCCRRFFYACGAVSARHIFALSSKAPLTDTPECAARNPGSAFRSAVVRGGGMLRMRHYLFL